MRIQGKKKIAIVYYVPLVSFLNGGREGGVIQYSRRGSRITPRPRGDVIILPMVPHRGASLGEVPGIIC